LLKACNPEVIVFFGPYHEGTQHEASCIDVAVFLNEYKEHEHHEIVRRLGGLVIGSDDNDDLYVMPRIFDYNRRGFAKESNILQTGEILYMKSDAKPKQLQLQPQ